jgi:formylglycine-generating enzyme required for sulfatase activity
VSWYDAVKWCNARSEMENIVPVYRNSNGSIYKTSEGEPIALNSSNGYRLPTENEWEWAARGGILSQGYVYSGGNNLNSVAVGYGGDQPVGTKIGNELGIHDMSGNVSEWVWDSVNPPSGSHYTIYRTYRGGDSFQSPNLEICKVAFRATGGTLPFLRPSNFGIRLAHNIHYDAMVTVQGGTLPTGSELAGQTVSTFEIGKYEVTWGEWKAVRAWAVANGYTDLAGIGGTYPDGAADNFPVCYVSWYDVVKWCNARSEKEGKTAVYLVSGAVYRSGEYGPYGSGVVTQKVVANGYRLPSEAEWEWAARGGVSSKGYTYSGSNDLNAIAWTWGNSSNETKAVGTKAGNELGIYDMIGNVWEWCWDVHDLYTSYRRIRGGGLRSDFEDANVSFNGYEPNPASRAYSDGFRLARRSGN